MKYGSEKQFWFQICQRPYKTTLAAEGHRAEWQFYYMKSRHWTKQNLEYTEQVFQDSVQNGRTEFRAEVNEVMR
jgi:hypothetical protein